jgi:hypothetical protein
MGVCARNIILVGDQMQLSPAAQGQPSGAIWPLCARTST